MKSYEKGNDKIKEAKNDIETKKKMEEVKGVEILSKKSEK